MSEETALAKVAGTTRVRTPAEQMLVAVMPSDYVGMTAFSEAMAASGLFGVKTPAGAMAIMLAGMEMGLAPVTALRLFHIIEGRPSLSADGMVALVKVSPACEWFVLVDSTVAAATYKTKRVGEPETQITYTMEDAERAGITGPTRNGKPSNWKKHPAQMCRARASSGLARAVYPDVVGGIYDPDELRETRNAAPARPEPRLEEAQEPPINAEWEEVPDVAPVAPAPPAQGHTQADDSRPPASAPQDQPQDWAAKARAWWAAQGHDPAVLDLVASLTTPHVSDQAEWARVRAGAQKWRKDPSAGLAYLCDIQTPPATTAEMRDYLGEWETDAESIEASEVWRHVRDRGLFATWLATRRRSDG